MGICHYCGRPAAFLRDEHAECHQRHEMGVKSIPGLVDKFIGAHIAPNRFHELLVQAAKSCFIAEPALASLVAGALKDFLEAKLEQRLLHEHEQQRAIALVAAFALPFHGTVWQLLVKIDILRTLDLGEIPTSVKLADELPIPLPKGEQIVWVFNRVTSRRIKGQPEDTAEQAQYTYVSRPRDQHAFVDDAANKEVNDLVVTNHNLHLLSSGGAVRRFALSRISKSKMHPFGISFTLASTTDRFISLDDPWFAANLVGKLSSNNLQGRNLVLNAAGSS